MPAAEFSEITTEEAQKLFKSFGSERALVLAVSGGPDSTALLFLAARWRSALGTKGPRLVAVTVDHALREGSAREAQAVKRLAARLKIDHITRRWTGQKPATGLQEAARLARYRLLADAARRVEARYILTGHTLDDQAETILFRMARGSGLAGLAGMAPQRPLSGAFVVRPFLELPKARLVATLEGAGIRYCDDPSNKDPRFARTRWRVLMQGLAREGLDARRLGVLANRIARADAALTAAAADAIATFGWKPDPLARRIVLQSAGFVALPTEIGIRVLGQIINELGDEGPVSLRKLEALHENLLAALSGGGAVCFRRTLAGALVAATRGLIEFTRAPARRNR